MADQTNSWHGAADTSWENGGNWTRGTPPQTDASNDTLIFLRNARFPPREDLDRSSDNLGDGLQPELIYIQSGTPYDIGQPGGELMVWAKKVLHRGSGTLHYISVGAALNDTLNVIIDSPNEVNAAILQSDATSLLTRVGVIRGGVHIALGTSTLAQLHVTRKRNFTEPVVTLAYGTGSVTIAIVNGGHVTSKVEIDHPIIRRGTLVLLGERGPTTTEVAGGRLSYGVPDSVMIALYAIGGTSNLIDGIAGDTRISNLFEFPGAKVVRDEAGDILTFFRLRTFGLDKE